MYCIYVRECNHNVFTGYWKFYCKDEKIQLDFKNFFKIKINVAV